MALLVVIWKTCSETRDLKDSTSIPFRLLSKPQTPENSIPLISVQRIIKTAYEILIDNKMDML